MFFKKNISKLVIFSLLSGLSISGYANIYNCTSNESNFNVSVRKDADGNWCVWCVKTGVNQPIGGYQPSIAVFNPIKFKLPSGVTYTIQNCSPHSFDADMMQYSDVTLICGYVPNGETDKHRWQELLYSNEAAFGSVLQQYQNDKWINAGPLCQLSTAYCRVAPPDRLLGK